MKIKAIRIEKFRAIRSCEIFVGTELALVGQNSAGKSSILRALNAFFNFEAEREFFERGRHEFLKTATCQIEIEFGNVAPVINIPRVAPGSDSVRARLKYKKSDVWQVFQNGNWVAAPADMHEHLAGAIRYVYVPLRRDHEVSGWGDSGLLQSAVEAWVKDHTRRRDTISPQVATLSQTIKSRAFDGLSKQLRKVTPLSGAFVFQLEYKQQPDYRLLLRDLVLRVSEGGTTVDLEDCGSGTQSMTAFALYSYLAGLQGNTYILGIEEPEQNLHPQAQRELLAALRKSPLQVLFTTHSTVMLDALQHEEVVLCRRVASRVRGVEVTTTQIPPTFWAANGLDKDRYYQFYKRRNSEFFFANYVILTESPIDSEIVSEILRKSNADPVTNSVSIISLDGVQSLPYAFQLLRALNVDFATIVDKDYFMPYLHDDLNASRDARGFPRYRREFKRDCLIESMLTDAADRATLLNRLHSNHSRAMDILEEVGVFCFRWSLEIDLIASINAQQALYNNLNIVAADRNSAYLLTNRRQQIKRLDVILPVVTALQPANLPNSYKRLRKCLPTAIRKASQLR